MPNITMLDIEALRATKLKPYIDKCLEHRAPDPGFHSIMGHNIDLCEAMFVAWDACFNKGRVPHKLKEVIRVQLSRAAADPLGNVRLLRRSDRDFSEALLGEGIDNYAVSERFTAAEKIALRYSELMSVNPDAVDAAFFDELRRHYSDDEIVESELSSASISGTTPFLAY